MTLMLMQLFPACIHIYSCNAKLFLCPGQPTNQPTNPASFSLYSAHADATLGAFCDKGTHIWWRVVIVTKVHTHGDVW